MWSREKDGKILYAPVPILADLAIGVHNLFVSGEDVLVMGGGKSNAARNQRSGRSAGREP